MGSLSLTWLRMKKYLYSRYENNLQLLSLFFCPFTNISLGSYSFHTYSTPAAPYLVSDSLFSPYIL